MYTIHKSCVTGRKSLFAAKCVDVDDLNFVIQQSLSGDLVSYKSIDSLCDANEAVNYTKEFLNSLDVSGMPPQVL